MRRLALIVLVSAVLLPACVKGLDVAVMNPCDHNVLVALSENYASTEERDSSSWSYLAIVPAGHAVHVGGVDDAAGPNYPGSTLWVDEADFRMDLSYRQVERTGRIVELPAGACEASK